MPWYPSAKACPAAIKPTVQCFFPTLYQVLLFDFSSFGEKLFFCLRGYRRAIARSAVQKTAGAQSEDVPLFTRRRTGGEWVEVATLPHHQQAMPRNRAKRGAKTAGAQSEDVPLFTRRRTGGEWVEEATWPYCWGSSKPCTTANKLSPRRAKLALNVRIGCSCRAHNHHKFSHRILQPHTKRRASHAD